MQEVPRPLECQQQERKKKEIHEKENVLLRETHVCRWPYARQLHNDGKNTRRYCRRRSSIGAEESARQASAPESQCGRGRQPGIFFVWRKSIEDPGTGCPAQ